MVDHAVRIRMDGGREDGAVADVDEDRAADSVPKSTPMAYLLNVPPLFETAALASRRVRRDSPSERALAKR